MAVTTDARLGNRLRAGAASPWRLLMGALDAPMRALQRRLGERGMPYAFLLPNLLFFGLFVFIPLGLNFVYSFTGGSQLYLTDRPFVGTQQYAELLACENHLEPGTCRQDHFWRGVYNTCLLRRGAGDGDGAGLAPHRPRAEQEDPGPRLLPRGLLLPRAALACRGGPRLEVDPPARRSPQRLDHGPRR
jgi:hypothetical protein